MKIEVVVTGMIMENCYIASDGDGRAAVVDPGDDAGRIIKAIERGGCSVEWILITHGHFDHIGAAAALKERTGARVAIHAADGAALRFRPDMEVKDGDVIRCGEMEFAVIETPGHTPGCVCYICGDAMFSGDTLFRESVGRTDMPGGSFADMRRSLIKLRDLSYERLDVFPGHMEPTTLEHERIHNPFMGI
jgi:glyoxylase-like metal-dependent hydrolase (beta-lactamase superfamily II)